MFLSDSAMEDSCLPPAERQGMPGLSASKEGEDTFMHNQQTG